MIKTITLDELIEELQEARTFHGGTAKVVFASSYGDRARTQQAHGIRGDIVEVPLRETAYSDSGYCVADSDDEAIGDTTADGDDITYLQIK